MTTESRFDRYRQLSARLGGQHAHALLDKLQVLALTQPETLREFEAFMDRGALAPHTAVYTGPDRRRQPDRRQASTIVAQERRRQTRRGRPAPL